MSEAQTSENTLSQHAQSVLEARNRAFRILFDTVLEVEGAGEKQVYSILCHNLRRICQARWASISSFNPAGNLLKLEAVDDPGSDADQTLAFSEDELTVSTDQHQVDHFSDAQVRSCTDHADCPVDNLYCSATGVSDFSQESNCYCLSCIREGELIAVGKVRLEPGRRMKMKDIVDTYLNLAGVILQRVNSVRDLRESEEKYRDVVERANDGIAIIQDGCLEYANSSLAQITGFRIEDIRGIPFIEFLDVAERPRVMEFYLQRMRGEPVKPVYETALLSKSGRRTPVEVNVGMISYRNKPGMLIIVRDITERKEAESRLEAMHGQLLEASRQAGMAEVASGVLHNVGNVLNSVNVSVDLIREKVRSSRVGNVARATDLMIEHADQLGEFLASDDRGKQLPTYLAGLASHLTQEHSSLLGEMETLVYNLQHVKEIVQMHQDYAGRCGMLEEVAPEALLEAALDMLSASLEVNGIEVIREYGSIPPMTTDRHKLLQILVNLLGNARDALSTSNRSKRKLRVSLGGADLGRVRVRIEDNGVGISRQDMDRIFNYGFTTKEQGHGFGLHSSALLARELGGSLTADSAGQGKGAVFVLELPLDCEESDDERF